MSAVWADDAQAMFADSVERFVTQTCTNGSWAWQVESQASDFSLRAVATVHARQPARETVATRSPTCGESAGAGSGHGRSRTWSKHLPKATA
ncbi:MAG: hypothetical protein EBY28_15480 [Betaproteobacteria bacterium]|nr:hypothetical protein [Betaproteobacteria bacterium]